MRGGQLPKYSRLLSIMNDNGVPARGRAAASNNKTGMIIEVYFMNSISFMRVH